MSLETWLIAFFAMVLLDVAYVLYMRTANRNHPFAAAFWALVLHGFGAVSVLSYTSDHRYITATLAGTFVGTYLVVLWTKRKDEKEAENEQP